MQMEIDYKAECHSGDAIESLGSSIKEDTNGTGILRWAFILLNMLFSCSMLIAAVIPLPHITACYEIKTCLVHQVWFAKLLQSASSTS